VTKEGCAVGTANAASGRANTAVAQSNQAKTEANAATVKANTAIAESNKNAQELADLRAEVTRLKLEIASKDIGLAVLKAAINTVRAEVETKEDKYIVRRVEQATITNASDIRDINGQLTGIPSVIGKTVNTMGATITKTFDGKIADLEERTKGGVGSGGISLQGAKDAVFGDLFGNTKANSQLKDVIGTEVSTQTKALEKVNTEQYNDIRDRISALPGIVTGVVTAGMVTTLSPIGAGVRTTVAQTTPAVLSSAAAAGVCSTTKPGGCMNNMNTNQTDRIRDVVNAAGTAASAANNALLLKMQGLLSTINATTKTIQSSTNIIQKAVTHATYGLQAAHRLANTAWKATHMDKVLNTLSVVIALHNAAMLSRNLGETLGDLTSQALSAIGIRDTEGQPLNINAAIGNSVNSMLTNILGAETYQGIKETWNKSSRILSSASTIVWTVRSIADSAREVTEWTAENTGKIGNALKRWRVVGENAYSWMPERMTAQNKWLARVERARNGIDSLDDAASSFSSVLGEVQNIQQEYSELSEQGTKFKDNIKELEPKEREQNEPVQLARRDERLASKSPSSQADVFRGEGESE
jgi:predicted nuclease with TOPRIM domain